MSSVFDEMQTLLKNRMQAVLGQTLLAIQLGDIALLAELEAEIVNIQTALSKVKQ